MLLYFAENIPDAANKTILDISDVQASQSASGRIEGKSLQDSIEFKVEAAWSQSANISNHSNKLMMEKQDLNDPWEEGHCDDKA